MSRASALVAGATGEADDLLARYEELRRNVLGARSGGLAVGLGMFVRQGMAAWMTAWSSTGDQATAAPRAHPDAGAGMPQGAQAEIVALLASMALGSMQGVTT